MAGSSHPRLCVECEDGRASGVLLAGHSTLRPSSSPRSSCRPRYLSPRATRPSKNSTQRRGRRLHATRPQYSSPWPQPRRSPPAGHGTPCLAAVDSVPWPIGRQEDRAVRRGGRDVECRGRQEDRGKADDAATRRGVAIPAASWSARTAVPRRMEYRGLQEYCGEAQSACCRASWNSSPCCSTENHSTQVRPSHDPASNPH